MKMIKILSFLVGFSLTTVVFGDDTDIYLNPGSGLPAGSEPMVMFSLDYRPNLASTACNGTECDTLIAEGYLSPTGPYTFFDVLRAALRKVMDPLEGIRVGLMLNHDNDNNCAGPGHTGCSNGGYIAMGFELFELGDTNGAKARFHQILASMPTPQGNQSHSYQGKELFFEMFRYLTGQGIYNAHNGWTDYSTDAVNNLDVDGAAYSWDTGIESGSGYASPLGAASECTKVFTVNPLFFVANQDEDSDGAIELDRSSGGFGGTYREFADVIGFLNDADLADGTFGSAPDLDGPQDVTSYFLVEPTKINRTTIGYASAGGTGLPLPLSESPDELVSTLQDIFRQILSVSTTFVAASVPVNVFNRAEIVDNVYIALFQVDENYQPAWPGNLKKLRLSSIDTATVLVDALDNPAIAGDGRIRNDALTFWTDPGSLPPADTSIGEVDGRDGRSISRGGAGQKVPGYVSGSPGLTNTSAGRRIFYDAAGSLAPFNASSTHALALQSDLGAADVTEAQELIAFMRGVDIDDLDGDSDVTEAREWIINDPLHSRPLPLNYGARGSYTTSNPAIYIAVATNDGLMHFIRNTNSSGNEIGVEAWAFAPRSTMGVAQTLRGNGAGVQHPYAVDGSPAAYIEDNNHNGTIEIGEKAYLFFGLRRGGRAYYALDVSDPESPSLLWTIDNSGDFSELGLTFSTPRVGEINIGSGPQPIVIFAGGYDTNKDTRGAVGTDDSEGNAIYVVDAETGALIWKARGGSGASTASEFQHPDLVDSIPSTVTIADTDGDLLVDRILVGDTGGNVWRADIHGSDTSQWTLTRLAALGRHSESGKINDRRFFHRPDLVPAEDDDGLFDAVILGSGDRPDPLDAGGLVNNWFYMIKDRDVVAGAGTDVSIVPNDLGDVTDDCLHEGGSCSVDLVHGWKLELETFGEKSLATPITIAGRIFFTTYIPSNSLSSSVCAPSEGQGRLYAVSLQTASAVINYDTADDDPDYQNSARTKSDRYTDLNSPGIPAEVVSIPPNQILRPDLQVDTIDVTTRWRTFWYLEEDTDL